MFSPAEATSKIKLDPQESAVLDLVDNFTKHLATSRSDLPKVECRVAGGWVRDKLLGLACEDLDICISSLTGHHFATLLEGYITQLRAQDSNPLLTNTKIAKIQANPDQSKHLETARMQVLGLEIDLVQLRSEEYANDSTAEGGSRIPTAIKFGTPLEDALRRDITINTLFYNVHSRLVEDCTQKGLHDLLSDSPLIRTPLEPLQTFLDDPLRILRCVRFASRFNFPLDESIGPAVRDERVRKALLKKVSKERIGVEFEKMLKGDNPLHAIQLMHELDLFPLIFVPIDPSTPLSAPIASDASTQAILASKILTAFSNPSSAPPGLRIPERMQRSLQSKSVRKKVWLATCLSPLRNITYPDKKGKQVPLVGSIVMESVKLSGSDRHFTEHIFAASRKLSLPELAKFRQEGPERERSRIGLLLRDPEVHDSNNELDWETSVLFSCIMDLLPVWGKDTNRAQIIIDIYMAFIARVEELQLNVRAFEKSRLDGKEIIALIGSNPGRLMSVLVARCVEWQLDHPDASKEETGQYLKQEWEAGRITLPEEQNQSHAPKPAAKEQKLQGKQKAKKRKESF